MSELENRKLLLCFIAIVALTIATQLVSLAFGASDPDQSFGDVFLPSTLALLAITVPLAGLGILIWKNIQFGGSPKLYAVMARRPGARTAIFRDIAVTSVAGFAVGLAMVGLRMALHHHLPDDLPDFGFRGVAGGLAVSIGAAVGEEVWFRLGLMSCLVWLLTKFTRQERPSDLTAWVGIFVLAVLFGAAHVPQLASFDAATPIGIAGTIFGNTVVGTLYGWFYWRKGLLAAISTHFWADVAIHVLPAF